MRLRLFVGLAASIALVLVTFNSSALSDCQDCISVNEFQFAPEGGSTNGDPDHTGEFLELFNKCNDSVDIGCMQLCMLTASFCGECVQIPAGTVLGPGEVFTMGGYGTNCSGGGVTACDYPGLNLDLNWHNCGCVNDPDAGISCSSANTGQYWGVLTDGGEDIYLFDANDNLIQGLTYGGGGGYQDGDCTPGGTISMSGCNGCSGSTVDPPASGSLTNIGGGGSLTGFQNDCGGGYTSISDTSNLTPGVADCSSLIDPPCCTVEADFSVSDSTQCLSSNSFSFSNQGSTGGAVEYEYDFGDGMLDSSKSPSHTYADTGVYQIRQIVDSNNNCQDTSFRSVVVGTVQVSTLSPDTLSCKVDSVKLDATASKTWPGSITYSWTSSGGNILSGSNSATAWVDQGGGYQVTIGDDSLNCSKDTTIKVPIDTASPEANVAIPDTLTCTQASVTLDGSASTSKHGHIYGWSTGDSTGTITVSSAGSYTLSVKDTGNGCIHDSTVTVANDTVAPQAAVAEPDTLTCTQASVTLDGSASMSKNGHIYGWSTGDSTATITVSSAGSYTLSVKDTGNGCTHDTMVTVAIDTLPPTVSIASADTLYCTTDSVILDGSSSTTNSGKKAYSWASLTGTILWDANTATPAVGSSGEYALTVTDPENGCISKDTVKVPADQDLPAVNVAPLDTITCTQNLVKVDASASTTSSGNKDFGWSTSGGNIVNAAADSSWIDVDAAASYKVSVTDQANGCTNSSTETVPIDTVPPDAKVALPDTLTCTTTSVTLDASATTSDDGHSYSWSNGDSGPTTMVSTAGSYTVTATDTSNGCTDDTTVMIPIDTSSPDPMVAAPDTLTCDVDTVMLDGSATTSANGHSYSWSNGDSGPTASVTAEGDYTLSVTDSYNGCTVDTTVTVPIDTVSPTPWIATPDTLTCSQPNVTLDASASMSNSGSKSYSWSNGDLGPTTSVSDSGSYSVMVTDINSGCTADTTVQVQQAGFPSIKVDSVVDASCNATCDGGAYISVSGGSTPYNYSWNDPGSQTVQDATGLCAGTYQVTVTDNDGCEVRDTVAIGEPTPVQISTVPDTTICIGGTATLSANASGGTPGYTYHWDNSLGTGQFKTVSPSSTTVYTVYAEDVNGCASISKTVRVDLHPELSVTALSDDSICPGASEQLSAVSSGGIGSGYSYSWSTGGNGKSISVTPTSTTDYIVTLEDACETPAVKDTVTVALHDLPNVQISGQDLKGCKPVDASLVNTTPPSMVGSNCTWDFGDGTHAVACDSISHTYDQPGCYDVTLSVSSPDGCVDSAKRTDYVCVHPYPTADYRYNPAETNVMDPAFEFTNTSTGAVDHTWRFADLDTLRAEHPSYQFPNDGPGAHRVCLEAINSYGCTDTVCKEVSIKGKFTLYVPNAFTPDGDGVNDKFAPVIRGADKSDFRFSIYDRWGEVVFETQNPDRKWDGSIKGDVSESKTDVYVWRLETRNKYTGEQIVRKGHVTLIR